MNRNKMDHIIFVHNIQAQYMCEDLKSSCSGVLKLHIYHLPTVNVHNIFEKIVKSALGKQALSGYSYSVPLINRTHILIPSFRSVEITQLMKKLIYCDGNRTVYCGPTGAVAECHTDHDSHNWCQDTDHGESKPPICSCSMGR